MSYRVVVTARARTDALETFRWLAERSPGAARRWYAGLLTTITELGEAPERYPIAEEESEQVGITLRQVLHGHRPGVYRILFSIDDAAQTVTLHYVRHSARGPLEE